MTLRVRCETCGDAIPLPDPSRCLRCGRTVPVVEGIFDLAPGFAPPGFSEARRDHLAALESEHFWFDSRIRLLRRVLARARPRRGGLGIELGCGTGTVLPELARRCAEVVGVDGHLESLRRARPRVPEALLLHADVQHLPVADAQADLVVALDVLEHVEAAPFVEEVRRVLRPGGTLVLSVPACPALWSALDVAAGHRRRYRLADLAQELGPLGDGIAGHTHYQLLLLPLVYVTRRLAGGAGHRIERRPPAWVGRLLGAVNRLETAVLGGISLPAGSSLLAWATKRP